MIDQTYSPAHQTCRQVARDRLSQNAPPAPLSSFGTAVGLAAHRCWEGKLNIGELSRQSGRITLLRGFPLPQKGSFCLQPDTRPSLAVCPTGRSNGRSVQPAVSPDAPLPAFPAS